MIEEFNQRVSNAHSAHYLNGLCMLVDTSINASPNANQIYHLYSTGKITHQKGAWAYLKRSEFTIDDTISNAKNLPFKFPLIQDNNITYAILTQKECIEFRKEMEDIISKYNL